MPNMDGFTACRKIRDHKTFNDVPIILITGLDDVKSIERAYEVDATDFATKPVNWIILIHRIRYILRSTSIFNELQKSQAQLSEAQRIAQIGYWELNTKTGALSVSQETLRIYGLSRDQSPIRLEYFMRSIVPEDRERVTLELNRSTANKRDYDFEFRISKSDSSTRTVVVKGHVMGRDVTGSVTVVGTIQDITSLRLSEERIHRLAYYDTLTGLPNRVSFRDTLDLMIANSTKSNRQFAIAYLDLDDFKRINDTLGHAAGDSLLQETAKRISAVVRGSDAISREANETHLNTSKNVSRVGGDEFILLLTGLKNSDDAEKIIQRVLSSFDSPYQLSNSEGTSSHEVFVTASVGVAVFQQHGDTVEELLKNADTAMFQAKRLGKNTWQFYAHQMNARSMERLDIEGKLRRALEKKQLKLHYQPQISLENGQPVGVEALLRWSGESLGNISPNEFIPIAEETGMIIPIGEWVMETACQQMKVWQDQGLAELIVSVNLSSVQFRQRDLDAKLLAIAERVGIKPQSIELELTESLIMSHAAENIRVLQGFKDKGFRLAVDDFGTGYSSLAYLKRFPLDTLKIDRAFVRDIEEDENDRTISAGIIALGHSLGMNIVAEGVETRVQQDILQNMGCDLVQGFYYSKPLPQDKVFAVLTQTFGTKAQAEDQ